MAHIHADGSEEFTERKLMSSDEVWQQLSELVYDYLCQPEPEFRCINRTFVAGFSVKELSQ